MPADSNIFQQYLSAPRSVADFAGDMDKQEQNKLTLAASRLQAQQAQQGMADDQAARQASIASGGDQNSLIQALHASGNYKAAQAAQKQLFESQKIQADTRLAGAHANNFTQQTESGKAKQQYEAAQHHAQGLAYIKTPQDVHAYIQQGIDKGVFPPQTPEQIAEKLKQYPSVDAFVAAAKEAAIPVLEQYKTAAENERNRLINLTSRQNNTDTNATSRANNSATVGATIRGQNLTDARTRESTAAAMSKPFEVTGPDGAPVLVQQDKQGNIKPVTGYSPKAAADKPLTEGQSKAALFGSRMQEADRILGDLSKAGTTTSTPGMGSGYGVGATINVMSSPQQQQLMQAKRDFLNAVLRRESGAAIVASEFENANKQYFPQMGDTPQVIAQKANNRAIAVRGMQAEIPKTQRGIVGEVINGKNVPPAKTSSGATVSGW